MLLWIVVEWCCSLDGSHKDLFAPLLTPISTQALHQSSQVPNSKLARFSTNVANVNTFSDDENVSKFAGTCSQIEKSNSERPLKEIHKTPQAYSLGIANDRLVRRPSVSSHLDIQGSSEVWLHDIRQLNCVFHDSLPLRYEKKILDELLSLFSRTHDNTIPLHDGTIADTLRSCTGTNNEYVDSAIQTFKNMLAKDSVTWVAIISGLSQNGRQVEASLTVTKVLSY
ncbi:pentatricopeptide repeat-containing protein [Striga asiatica]|uniref:Pentatricopeptide repeat-containing protein n=1 Tax=Striga asiatica TaxID=4170 RepID=A0A5A7QNY3_STRAF|nr:pentatricopeptide repeat-containing protein [Striga asiatica]